MSENGKPKRRLRRRLGWVALGFVLVVALLVGVAAYALDPGGDPPDPAGLGANPQVAPADEQTIPTVNAANVIGWPDDKAPVAPPGFTVKRFAAGLDHPRWLYELPNGDVLAAEAATTPATSLFDSLFELVRGNDGSRKQSANRITLLRDADGDGTAEFRTPFLEGLSQPFGMALIGESLYVGNTDSVWRYPYRAGETRVSAPGQKILDLPAGGYNNHWTRNVVAAPDGSKLYITVGSGSNIAENGLDNEIRRAMVLEINPDGTGERVLASGMRNPNGLDFEPQSGALWTVVNERDMLGDDAPPDYFTRVRDGDFYGWPWSYWGQRVDSRVEPQRPDLVANSLVPDYSLGAHTAPLGLAFYRGETFPERFRGGAFIGAHGSWNRGRSVGFTVNFVPFRDGMPSGPPEDFLTGFKPDPDNADTYGRPVGVIGTKTGDLLVADDAGNIVWRVAPQG
ncbi:sorbosone dehydrogenase family protein [Amycolatopsis sp. YIM 10]|uniref:PQQ-dependent sugar dehydrogenase n=1 Tax=Amycolatopsis sp. YIM 10 TaxID=2653857 RepID=UPI001290375D|nr:sorbosone dehydrogenase family protein [Amycolatopsis sp. YIM 10]QFU92407.1 Soluble aldose sugar dehydrogenase YliI precursor [Amycolatopsis sp. YIM 10]